jgi:hypothetical protein
MEKVGGNLKFIGIAAVAALLFAAVASGCGSSKSASGPHYSLVGVARCLKAQGVSVKIVSVAQTADGRVKLSAAEGELIVNWPKGTPGSGTGTSSRQDDLLLRFDGDAGSAAETLKRLEAFNASIENNKDVDGRRGNVVFYWPVNEHHHPGAAMHSHFDGCVRP